MNERKDLSPSEAAVLSALYILGRGTASEIAKISGIYTDCEKHVAKTKR